MYETKDLQAANQLLKKRWLATSIPCVIGLVAIVISFVVRIEWLTIVLTVLTGGAFIFCFGLYISPAASYARFVSNMLNGRMRTYTGVYKAIGKSPCTREGVSFYSILINVGEKDLEEDDRLFYYDVQKGTPPFAFGDRVTVTSHDKGVSDMVPA